MSDITKTFKDNLSAGKYGSITGARRAIGKFRDASDEEKEAMRKIADKHFGDSPAAAAAPAKPAAKKEPKAAKPASTATAEEPKKRGRKPKAEAEVSGKTSVEAVVRMADSQLTTLERAIKNLLDLGKSGVNVTDELAKAKLGINQVLNDINTAAGVTQAAAPASTPSSPVTSSSQMPQATTITPNGATPFPFSSSAG